MCGLNIGPTWDSCAFFLFFKWAFDGPELGTNCALWGCFVGPTYGLPTCDPAPFGHICLTKAAIGLAHMWAERGYYMGLLCVFPRGLSRCNCRWMYANAKIAASFWNKSWFIKFKTLQIWHRFQKLRIAQRINSCTHGVEWAQSKQEMNGYSYHC